MCFELCLIIVIFFAVAMLGSSRLGTIIWFFVAQSFVLSLTPLFVSSGLHAFIMTAVMLIVKVFLMPGLLFWTIRNTAIRREVDPLIGYGKTLLLGGFLVIIAFILSAKIEVPVEQISALLVPAAFSTGMLGFLLMISRHKAITQVIGYLVMENGIFLFSLLLLDKTPFLVEMGILLDIFVGVLVLGIIVNHIDQFFGTTNTMNLTKLKE
jgi:hydrogenase-4 component E